MSPPQYAVIHVQYDPSGGHAWPIVERVEDVLGGGWQSGSHHYPDDAVLDVRPLTLIATRPVGDELADYPPELTRALRHLRTWEGDPETYQAVTFLLAAFDDRDMKLAAARAEVERLREEGADNANELTQLRPPVRVLIRDDTRALARGEGRAELVARLRAVIEWVSERDHARAVELDAVVHELEQLAARALDAAPAPKD